MVLLACVVDCLFVCALLRMCLLACLFGGCSCSGVCVYLFVHLFGFVLRVCLVVC